MRYFPLFFQVEKGFITLYFKFKTNFWGLKHITNIFLQFLVFFWIIIILENRLKDFFSCQITIWDQNIILGLLGPVIKNMKICDYLLYVY